MYVILSEHKSIMIHLTTMQKSGRKTARPVGVNFGVFPQVLTTMLLISLLPLASLWYVNTRLSQRDINQNITTNLEQITEALVLQTNNWVSTNLRMLSYSAQLEAIRNMDSEAQKPILKAMNDSYEWIYLAFTVNASGENIGRNDEQKPEAYYFGDRSYFKQVMEDNLAVGQQMLIGRTSGKPSLVLAKAVIDNDANKIGIVAMSAQVQEISDAVVKARVGETGFAFLLDETGQVIAHGQPENLSEVLEDYSEHPALQSPVEAVFNYTLDNEKFVSYTKTTDLGWTMVVQQDYNEAFASLRRSRQLGVALLLITISLVLLIAYLLTRRFVKPIQNLTGIADEVSRGRSSKEIIETQRNDEIGALAKAIERMRVSINLAFKELDKK